MVLGVQPWQRRSFCERGCVYAACSLLARHDCRYLPCAPLAISRPNPEGSQSRGSYESDTLLLSWTK